MTKEKYSSIILEALNNWGLDNDDNSWMQSLEFSNFVQNKEEFVLEDSKTLQITNNEGIMFLIRLNKDEISMGEVLNKISEALLKYKGNRSILQKVYLLWFVRNIKSRIEIDSIFSDTNRFKRDLRTNGIKGVRMVRSIPYLDIDSKIKTKEFKLEAKRYEMLEHPCRDYIKAEEKEEDGLKGYIFTANLYDVVTLYNEIGDEIFKKNLRLGIKEQMGVDSAIQDTLKNAPGSFWFRNGGITILIQRPNPIFDRTNEVVLKRSDESKINFWVINGAQTISAAADFYYGSFSKDEESVLEDAKKAKVIVRIIQINEESQTEDRNADIISIALNRQKPIKDEDIAFTNIFVHELNDYLNESNAKYTLCRRSEVVYSQDVISLVEFARARKALAGRPGEARSSAASALLKTKDDVFQDCDIFAKELQKPDYDFQMVYQKYYKPIFESILLSRNYENNIKAAIKTLDDEPKQFADIIGNGKWYFTAFSIFVLNEYNDEDYTGFNYSFLKQQSMGEAMIAFARVLYQAIKNDDSKSDDINIDSNLFKNSKIYEVLRDKYKNSENQEDAIFKEYFNCLIALFKQDA